VDLQRDRDSRGLRRVGERADVGEEQRLVLLRIRRVAADRGVDDRDPVALRPLDDGERVVEPSCVVRIEWPLMETAASP
jgi:hypothetical protein